MMRIHFSLLHLFHKAEKKPLRLCRRDLGDIYLYIVYIYIMYIFQLLESTFVLLLGMYDGGPVTQEPSQVPGGQVLRERRQVHRLSGQGQGQ